MKSKKIAKLVATPLVAILVLAGMIGFLSGIAAIAVAIKIADAVGI